MRFFIVIAIVLVTTGCAAGSDIFPDVGTNVASPVSMTINSTNRRLYLINSNSEVLYDWKQGSFQVLNITNARAPTLINTLQTKSFSGELYLDAANNRAFVVNRFSDEASVKADRLLTINVDETSGNFLNVTETSVGLDPFAVLCCDASNRLYFSTSEGKLQSFDTTASSVNVESVTLLRSLSSGSSITRATVTDIVLIGTQLFLSRTEGGVYVVNVNEVGNNSVNPVDYFISDLTPRGLATDGTSLFVVDEGVDGGSFQSRLLILNISSLTALTDNDTVTVRDKNDHGLLSAEIGIGRNPQRILIDSGLAFVTNQGDDTLSVINLAANSVTKTITVGDEPFGLALDTDANNTKTLYVSNLAANTISIIDVSNLAVVATYP